ncbi:MAG TPA: UDP-N-acetylglucosamine 2-epimerase (non-hydrolyzing) [candidate division Zixibacteria bacterium]|nr:UDP-N-acetylglucosamine 2-epimerase (non-hydrolyzing) [candidate division Zixibacteria bacterium]
MKKIVEIVGARPQFIKLAPLSKEIRKYYHEVIIHTGQHFDNEMSKLFFIDLKIPEPRYNFNINGGHHGEQTGKMLIEIEKVLLEEKPDFVIVFGDTNSTLAGSLAAAKLGIKSIHIEAGLRSFNRSMPEEINRIVSDHTSDYLFAPTKTAYNNLKKEGLDDKTFLTGDIMVDSLLQAVKVGDSSVLKDKYSLAEYDYYLCTLHRPYNVDEPKNLQAILTQLGQLSKTVLFPVHPRTNQIIEKNQISISSNISLIKPLGYLDFVLLQSRSYKIITDSGGIQKEAYILKKPCITLRSETEWIETVELGWNLLINPHKENGISQRIESFLPSKEHKKIFGANVAKKMIRVINKNGIQ